MQRAQDLELCVPHFHLPDWFPCLESSSRNLAEQVPQYILSPHASMQKLENARHLKITAIYDELFVLMWNTGRKLKRAKGRIVYEHITPPWLIGDIIFVYELHRNHSVLFTEKRIPAESEIREVGDTNLAMAILTTFLIKEKPIGAFLTALFRNSVIHLSDSDNSHRL